MVTSSRLTRRSEDRPRGPSWILLSPRRAFLGARERPRALLLVLAVSLLAALPAIAFVSTVELGPFLVKQMKASGQDLDEMPPEAQTFVREQLPKAMRVVIPVGAAGKRAGWILLLGVLGFALLRGGYPQLRFAQATAAIALGCAPLILADLLTAAVFVVKDPSRLDPLNPILSNPAAWLGLSVDKSVAGAVLHRLDLFQLWSLALCARGLNVVAGARSRVPWVLVVVALVGLTAMDAMGAFTASRMAGQ